MLRAKGVLKPVTEKVRDRLVIDLEIRALARDLRSAAILELLAAEQRMSVLDLRSKAEEPAGVLQGIA